MQRMMQKKWADMFKRVLCHVLVLTMVLGVTPLSHLAQAEDTDVPSMDVPFARSADEGEVDLEQESGTAKPEPTPVAMLEREFTQKPEVTREPEIMQTPENAQEPAATPKPEATSESEVASEPTVSPTPEVINNRVTGYVWLDENGDGYWNNGESALANFLVQLLKDGDRGQIAATVRTQSNGSYAFENVQPGQYTIYAAQTEAHRWPTATGDNQVRGNGHTALFTLKSDTVIDGVGIGMEPSAVPEAPDENEAALAKPQSDPEPAVGKAGVTSSTITNNSAWVNALVNTGNATRPIRIQYRTETDLNWTTVHSESLLSDNLVFKTITGLPEGTECRVRFAMFGTSGWEYGEESLPFTTIGVPTKEAITQTAATHNTVEFAMLFTSSPGTSANTGRAIASHDVYYRFYGGSSDPFTRLPNPMTGVNGQTSGTGTGTLSNLLPGMKYQVYATLSNGYVINNEAMISILETMPYVITKQYRSLDGETTLQADATQDMTGTPYSATRNYSETAPAHTGWTCVGYTINGTVYAGQTATIINVSADATVVFLYEKNQLTITERFLDDQGNPIASDNFVPVTYDTAYTGTPPATIPDGSGTDYRYAGYRIGTTGAITMTPTSPVTIPSVQADETVEYYYAKGNLITVKYEDEHGVPLPEQSTIYEYFADGGSFTADTNPAGAITGYDYVGWSLDGTPQGATAPTISNITGDHTIVLIYLPRIIIHYDGRGGAPSGGGSSFPDMEVPMTQTFTPYDTTKAGYEFAGWRTQVGGGNPAATSTTPIALDATLGPNNKEVTLYAHWISAATEAADQIKAASARLNGEYYTDGLTAKVYYEYGTAPGVYDGTIDYNLAAQSAADTPAPTVLTGLEEDTQYYYRIAMKMDDGTVAYGLEEMFRTMKLPRVAVDHKALSGTSARLDGAYTLEGSAFVAGKFEVSDDGGLTWDVPIQAGGILDGSTATPTATLTGLNPAITYKYRLTVESEAGSVTDGPHAFMLEQRVDIEYVDMTGALLSTQPTPDHVNVATDDPYTPPSGAVSGYEPVYYKVVGDPQNTIRGLMNSVMVSKAMTIQVYYYSTVIDVDVPTPMDFTAKDIDLGQVRSGTYTWENRSDCEVKVTFKGMIVDNADGVNFVSSASPAGDKQIHLNVDLPGSPPGVNGFTAGESNINPGATYTTVFGNLDGVHFGTNGTAKGYTTLGGWYAGVYTRQPYRPELTLAFELELVAPQFVIIPDVV